MCAVPKRMQTLAFFYNWNVSIGGNLRNLSFAGWIRMVQRESNLWSWINVQIFFLGSFTMFLAWTSIYFWTRMRRGDVWHRLKCAASNKFMLDWWWFVWTKFSSVGRLKVWWLFSRFHIDSTFGGSFIWDEKSYHDNKWSWRNFFHSQNMPK